MLTVLLELCSRKTVCLSEQTHVHTGYNVRTQTSEQISGQNGGYLLMYMYTLPPMGILQIHKVTSSQVA